jgi:hypothetical protein
MVGDDFCYGAKRAGNVANADRSRQAATASTSNPADGDERQARVSRRPPCAPRWPRATSRKPRAARPRLRHFRPRDPRPEAGPHARLSDPEPARGAPPRPVRHLRRAGAWPGRRSRCRPSPAWACARPSTTAAACCWKCTCSTSPKQCYGKLVRVEFLQKMRDEEKYVDLADPDRRHRPRRAQARAYFKDARRRPDRHRPNLTARPAPRPLAPDPPRYTSLKKTMSDKQNKPASRKRSRTRQAGQQIPGQHDRHPVPDARRPRQARAAGSSNGRTRRSTSACARPPRAVRNSSCTTARRMPTATSTSATRSTRS